MKEVNPPPRYDKVYQDAMERMDKEEAMPAEFKPKAVSDLREKLGKFLFDFAIEVNHGEGFSVTRWEDLGCTEAYCEKADQILALGLVELAGKQDLPPNPWIQEGEGAEMSPYRPWDEYEKLNIQAKIEAARKEIRDIESFIRQQEARLKEGCCYMDWGNLGGQK